MAGDPALTDLAECRVAVETIRSVFDDVYSVDTG